MKFNAHGVYNVEVKDGVLIVDATGPFNVQLAENYQRHIRLAVEKLAGTSWKQIISLHKLSIFTPDAEKILRKTMEYRVKSGLCYCAMVFNDCEAVPLIKEQLSRNYRALNLPHGYYDTIELALNAIKDDNLSSMP